MRSGVLTAAAVLILAAAPMAHAKGDHADSGQTTVFCSDGSITYSPSTLWPPDHKMVPIAISFNQPCDEGAFPNPQFCLRHGADQYNGEFDHEQRRAGRKRMRQAGS